LAAAYNAGSDWVGLWLAAGGGPHPLFPLAIPYRETRGYALAVAEGLWLARHLE
jgi:soluble lytic murein transglycosylase-like protein